MYVPWWSTMRVALVNRSRHFIHVSPPHALSNKNNDNNACRFATPGRMARQMDRG
jgi:hypothetical protein